MSLPSKSKTKDKAFWTIPDIAQFLVVSPRTVWRWIDTGDLVPHRFGRSVRIADGDLKAFLAMHRGV